MTFKANFSQPFLGETQCVHHKKLLSKRNNRTWSNTIHSPCAWLRWFTQHKISCCHFVDVYIRYRLYIARDLEIPLATSVWRSTFHYHHGTNTMPVYRLATTTVNKKMLKVIWTFWKWSEKWLKFYLGHWIHLNGYWSSWINSDKFQRKFRNSAQCLIQLIFSVFSMH